MRYSCARVRPVHAQVARINIRKERRASLCKGEPHVDIDTGMRVPAPHVDSNPPAFAACKYLKYSNREVGKLEKGMECT